MSSGNELMELMLIEIAKPSALNKYLHKNDVWKKSVNDVYADVSLKWNGK